MKLPPLVNITYIFYHLAKKSGNPEIEYVKFFYECICCHQEFLARYNKYCVEPFIGFYDIKKLYQNKQLICGYDPNQTVPFIPASEYLGTDAAEIIALKYLEFCKAGISDSLLEQSLFEYFQEEFAARCSDERSYSEDAPEPKEEPHVRVLKYYSPKEGRRRAPKISR